MNHERDEPRRKKTQDLGHFMGGLCELLSKMAMAPKTRDPFVNYSISAGYGCNHYPQV
jgi:hypothetical protein